MTIREFNPDDIVQVEKIHAKYHKNDFDVSELSDINIIDKIVVVDNEDQIITFGGIRLMIEVVAVTDMDRSVRERMEALHNLLLALKFVAKNRGMDRLHCSTINNDNWYNQLIKSGFQPTKGKVLYLDF